MTESGFYVSNLLAHGFDVRNNISVSRLQTDGGFKDWQANKKLIEKSVVAG